MTTVFVLFCVVPLAICVIWVLIMLVTAQDGYEDETGFHRGRKP